MAKYHINSATGRPGLCKASVRDCPHGGDENHFPTKEAARQEIEKRLKSFEVPTGIKKNTSGSNSNSHKKSIRKRTLEDVEEELKDFENKLKIIKKEISIYEDKINKTEEKMDENKVIKDSLDKLQIPEEFINEEKIRLTDEYEDLSHEIKELNNNREMREKEGGEIVQEIWRLRGERGNLREDRNKLLDNSKSTPNSPSNSSYYGVAGCASAPPLTC